MMFGNGESGIGNRKGESSLFLSRHRGCGCRCDTAEGSPQTAFPDSRFPISHFPRASREKGFSLLEVIAAIMLLAIAFTGLMKVAGASIALTQNAADYSEAAMWARSRMDSAFVGEPIKPGTSSGQFNPKFRWQLQVTEWNRSTPPQAPLHLYQLDLNVTWGPTTHPRSAHFRTLRLGGPGQLGNVQASR
jgi:general secretion pathway protein I